MSNQEERAPERMSDEIPEPVRCMNVLLEDDYTLTVQPFSLDELDEILMQSGAVGLYDMDGNQCMVGKGRIIAITHGWVVDLGYPQGWVPTARSGSLEGDELNG